VTRILYVTLAILLLGASVGLAQSVPAPESKSTHRDFANPEPSVRNWADREWPNQTSRNGDRSELVRSERAAETLIAEGIDAERARFAPDAPRLAQDPDLTDIARERSDTMAHGAPFSHEDVNGRFIAADMVRERFGPHGAIGENILEMHGSQGFDAASFAQNAVSSWMTSPGHRANILSPDYVSSGIGVAVNGGDAYATQVFRAPPKGAATHPPS
jgi:uncharacterized protein YkwD